MYPPHTLGLATISVIEGKGNMSEGGGGIKTRMTCIVHFVSIHPKVTSEFDDKGLQERENEG